MHKGIRRLAALALAAVCLAGCRPPRPLTLEQIAADNTGEALWARRASVYRKMEEKFPEGDRVSEQLWAVWDGTRGVHGWDPGGSQYLVLEDRRMFAQSPQGEVLARLFLDDGLFEEDWLPYIQTQIYQWDPAEQWVSGETVAGVSTVVTDMPAQPEDCMALYGLREGLLRFRYSLDAATGELTKVEVFHRLGEQDTLLRTETIAYGQDPGPLPDFAAAGPDACALTLVTDPGGAEEKSYAYTVPGGAWFSLMSRRPYALYSDAACSIPFTGFAEDYYPTVATLFCLWTE
jgi:hypothetical protein